MCVCVCYYLSYHIFEISMEINKKDFYNKLNVIYNDNKKRRKYFTKEKLFSYIEICKKSKPKTANDYYILNHFQTWYNDDTGNYYLIKKQSKWEQPLPPILIPYENIYQYIKSAHDKTLHSGIKKTYKEVQKLVQNIKLIDVETYISLCNYCQNVKKVKNSKVSRYIVKSPIISKYFNQRVQIDLIDVKNLQAKNCSYVLNYQDNLTKFCILKPLTDKKSVKHALIEIFNLFGAPKILHSDNGGEFRNKEILNYLAEFWPDMQIIRGKPYNPRSQGSVERANGQIKKLILAAITHGALNYDMISILHHVQYVKNTLVNRTIGCTPYYAVFGQNVIIDQKIENIFKTKELEDSEEEVIMMEEGEEEEEEEKDCIQQRDKLLTSIRMNTFNNTIKNSEKLLPTTSQQPDT